MGAEIWNFEGNTIFLKFSEKILVKEILLYLHTDRSYEFFIISGWNNFFRKVWDDLEPWFCARNVAGPGRIIKTYVKLISETGARAPLRAPRAPILYIRVNDFFNGNILLCFVFYRHSMYGGWQLLLIWMWKIINLFCWKEERCQWTRLFLEVKKLLNLLIWRNTTPFGKRRFLKTILTNKSF